MGWDDVGPDLLDLYVILPVHWYSWAHLVFFLVCGLLAGWLVFTHHSSALISCHFSCPYSAPAFSGFFVFIRLACSVFGLGV